MKDLKNSSNEEKNEEKNILKKTSITKKQKKLVDMEGFVTVRPVLL